MEYKVGDKVRIKDDISRCSSGDHAGKMDKWQGQVMTIADIITSTKYRVVDDCGAWVWHEDMIAGLVEPKLTNTGILKEAIAIFGEDEQIRMCHEEMDELGVALSKYHRNPCGDTEVNVQEEISDVSIMLQQMKIIFGEKEVHAIIRQKMKRLEQLVEDEREIEVVVGKYELNGGICTWINPDNYPVEIGGIVMADTAYGDKPIIVLCKRPGKMKDFKDYRPIVGGVE